MTKKQFTSLLLGVLGGLLFSIGLCMCLLPQWDCFREGAAVTVAGLVLMAVLVLRLWLRSGKRMGKINWKTVGKVCYGIFSTMVLGIGLCLVLVWEQLLLGILVGSVGILLLLCLIPMCFGFRKEGE